MTEQANRVEVTAIRWLIRPRRRDEIYLAAVDYRVHCRPSEMVVLFVGSPQAMMGTAMVGPDDANVPDGGFQDIREQVRYEVFAFVRDEVEKMCPPLGHATYTFATP